MKNILANLGGRKDARMLPVLFMETETLLCRLSSEENNLTRNITGYCTANSINLQLLTKIS